mgnify:CR=1 FL=1
MLKNHVSITAAAASVAAPSPRTTASSPASAPTAQKCSVSAPRPACPSPEEVSALNLLRQMTPERFRAQFSTL